MTLVIPLANSPLFRGVDLCNYLENFINDMDVCLLMKLYKYREYTLRSLEMFINKQIYFPKPEELNDPFDCRMLEGISYDISEHDKHFYINSSLSFEKNTMETLIKIYKDCQEKAQQLGIYSLSRNLRSVLLWSHYADQHRGFVVGFNLNDDTVSKNIPDIIDFTPVTYVSKNPFPTNYIELFTDSYGHHLYGQEFSTRYFTEKKLMTSKTKPWSYEKEYRLIREKSGFVNFDPKIVNEVVFGAAMSDAHIQTFIKLLSNTEWSHVKLKRACLGADLRILISDFKVDNNAV